MARIIVFAALVLGTPWAWGGEKNLVEGPAAQRGWIVVVRVPDGSATSGRLTEELPGKYASRTIEDPSQLRVQTFENLKMKVGIGEGEWSLVASRWYQGAGFLMTNLAFLDPPSREFGDRQALDLLLGYRSFTFGEVTYVIFCPPRAKVSWRGGFSLEPIIDGECKSDATVTIELDKRTPTTISGKLVKIERGMGRILVSQSGK